MDGDAVISHDVLASYAADAALEITGVGELVDDDADALSMATDVLSIAGAAVVSAGNAAATGVGEAATFEAAGGDPGMERKSPSTPAAAKPTIKRTRRFDRFILVRRQIVCGCCVL